MRRGLMSNCFDHYSYCSLSLFLLLFLLSLLSWFIIARPCNVFVVLRRVRNSRTIIIIISAMPNAIIIGIQPVRPSVCLSQTDFLSKLINTSSSRRRYAHELRSSTAREHD